MKSKKLLSCVMALSVIAASSLTLGTTAKAAASKAATLSSTSNTSLTKTLSTQSIGQNLLLNMTSDGTFTWQKMSSSVAIYRWNLNPGTPGGSSIGGMSYNALSTNFKGSNIVPGTYTFTIKENNSSDVTLGEQSITFIYNGSTYNTIGLNASLAQDGTLSWSPLSAASSYKCYIYTDSKYNGDVWTVSNVNTTFPLKSQPLTPGYYNITLDAIDSNFNILESQTLTFYYSGVVYVQY